MNEPRGTKYYILLVLVVFFIFALLFSFPRWGFYQESDKEKYRTPEEQNAFFEGRSIGYQEGYDAAKHNLSYGIVWERFNFTCAEGKNESEQINKCITD